MRITPLAASLALGLASLTPVALAADPWADAVVSYDPGSNPVPGFVTSSAALGAPTRYTSPPPALYGGVVTPLNSSFGTDESVSIGVGGSLVLSFAEPVTNHPLNPFGIDLLIFGNSFLTGNFSNPDYSFNPAGIVAGVDSEGGKIEISADGLTYYEIAGNADGLFPTNAYADVTDPFATTPGLVETDFTRPVDPAFSVIGKTFAEVIAGYSGAGGGFGIDIGSIGLSNISYVKITNPAGSGVTPEIDAIADVRAVPEPATLALLAIAGIGLGINARTRRSR